MSEPDLFAEQDPRSAAADPRKPRMVDAPELPKGPPRMRDATHIQQVIKEVVMSLAPPASDIAKYRGSGWNQPDAHRWRFEDQEIVVQGILAPPKSGAITEPHFRWMVETSLDKANLGTFHANLNREQGNGLWVPCEVATTTRMVPKNDLIRRVKNFVSPEEGIEEWPEYPPTEAVPVATEVVIARIRWVDAKNAPAIEYDAQGQPVSGPRVSINAGLSPEVAATLERIASQGGGDGRTADALMAVVAEMRADREARAIVPPKGVDPKDPAEREVEAATKTPPPSVTGPKVPPRADEPPLPDDDFDFKPPTKK